MIKSIQSMAVAAYSSEVLSVGVDAYTAIFRGVMKQTKGMEQVKFVSDLVGADKLKHRPFNNHQYQGFVNDFFFYGNKGNNLMFGAIGDASRVVEERCRSFFPDVTRIDLQVTVQLVEADITLAEGIYREQQRIAGIKSRHPKPSFNSSDTGDTVYLGKRGSDILLRVYDKGKDFQVDKGIIWRWEAEFRNEKATNVAHNLARANDVEDYILRLLFNEFYKKAVRIPVTYGEKVTVMGTAPLDRGNEVYLDWARRVLSSSMKRLSTFHEGVQLLYELGIQPALWEEDEEGNLTKPDDQVK